MNMYTNAITGTEPVRLAGIGPWAVEAGLVASTVLLPMVAHLFGWPVLYLLPMFWGVVAAGLVYGWQGGLLAAVAAPLLNTVITGMPLPAILPAMIVELAAYGIIPTLLMGLKGEGKHIPAPLALLVAFVTGRALLLLVWSLTAGSPAGIGHFASARLAPGIPVQLLQLLLMPFLAEAIKKVLRPERKDA